MPRFSQAAVPLSQVPSSRPLKAETGRSSPFRPLIGSTIERTNSGREASEVCTKPLSSIEAHSAGTSIFSTASPPASTAA